MVPVSKINRAFFFLTDFFHMDEQAAAFRNVNVKQKAGPHSKSNFGCQG